MVELACESEPLFAPSRLEEGAARSYSIHTVERVRAAEGPDATIFFIIGADAFAEIRSWYRWQDVIRAVEFIVVTRPGHAVFDARRARAFTAWTPLRCLSRLPTFGAGWQPGSRHPSYRPTSSPTFASIACTLCA